jgi:hypothetical protein
MVVLELRDAAAGVVARSYRREEGLAFLQWCIAAAQAKVDELDGVDPTAEALLEAEVTRLRTIAQILYLTVRAAPQAGSTDGGPALADVLRA